jgi:predicted outer membrane repeat protein
VSFFSWLSNRKSATGRPAAPSRQRAAFRPALEVLEDRCVPSTLKVTNGLDGGRGSLRDALAHANSSGKDVIVFASDIQTVNLSRQLNVTVGVTIQGPRDGLLTLTTNYNVGDPWGQTTRVFEVNASRPVVISGLTISGNGGSSQGAAILNHSTLTVSGCDFSSNRADNGGAIYNAGTMTLSGCTLSEDYAYADGGAIYNAGTMTLSGCTLDGNDDAFGYAIYNAGTLTVTGCTLRPYSQGDGGIYNAGTLTVGTSTFVWTSVSGPYTDAGGNLFITGQPQIGSFTASASTVSAWDSLTLTVAGVTDPNPGASITQVLFYVNGTPFGTATQSSTGVWTFTSTVGAWAPGTYIFSAVVVDSYGTSSSAVGPTVQVV